MSSILPKNERKQVDLRYHSRGVVPGGAWGAMTPPDFGRSVNPILTKGSDYAYHPDFQTLFWT